MTKTRAWLHKLKPSPLTLLLIGLIVYFWFRPPAWVTELDRPAPDVPLTVGERPRSLAELRGRVVLVNFWATWCPYCRHEMPAMEAFYRDYKTRGFEIVALSLDERQSAVDAFMRREGYTFPAWLAAPGVDAAFGVSRLPTSFVIDRRGHIRYEIAGQVHYGRLEERVRPLLAERP